MHVGDGAIRSTRPSRSTTNTYTHTNTYIYIYIYIHIHTYTHTYIQMTVLSNQQDRLALQRIHTYTHTYMHTHTHTCIHTHIHTYTHTHIHTYIHTGDGIIQSTRPSRSTTNYRHDSRRTPFDFRQEHTHVFMSVCIGICECVCA